MWVRIPFRRGVLDTTLRDKVCQSLATGRWISPGIPVSSTNKTGRHDITEILLKVAFNTIKLNQTNLFIMFVCFNSLFLFFSFFLTFLFFLSVVCILLKPDYLFH